MNGMRKNHAALWIPIDLQRYSSAVADRLSERGRIYESSRMKNTVWSIVWTDLGRVCQLVASQWGYPGLWRISANLPEVGAQEINRRLVKRLELNPYRLAQSPPPSELTCTGREMVELAAASITLAQGEPDYHPMFPAPLVPGCQWTPEAAALLADGQWVFHQERWHLRKDPPTKKGRLVG